MSGSFIDHYFHLYPFAECSSRALYPLPECCEESNKTRTPSHQTAPGFIPLLLILFKAIKLPQVLGILQGIFYILLITSVSLLSYFNMSQGYSHLPNEQRCEQD
jgi:hypothetical protein